MRLYVSLGFGILYHTTRTSANDLARRRLHFWSTTATDVHTRCLCIVAALVVHTAMYLCEFVSKRNCQGKTLLQRSRQGAERVSISSVGCSSCGECSYY